ncbi:phosphohydrolase [Mesorhizobium sp. LSJC285A00]|uniref:HD domain-containing protein n=1 Tax=Mesorhizobium sp. LSJC285A00 TaxID=1287338 RepID=UPI0003CE2B7B|nr:HD domain-containing protein [Mesorhizobium sp. LSJC285A00]ESW78194.1 phosphohydrolase [Mesorhizobium sp. LSJC285A00]
MPETINKMIKDPIHGFIDFNGERENELKLLLSDPFFQRLRRVKQLGFSDYVFPSAAHSRFGHSLGVYNIAKRMLDVVEPGKARGEWSETALACLAAALLHDVGHGMFSHAFEKAMNLFFDRNPDETTTRYNLKDAVDHEKVSRNIILKSSLSDILKRAGGASFPNIVSDMIGKNDENCIYTSIVSSQLDADRLDYTKRDPYFAGVSSGGVDLDWLIRNFKVGENGKARFLYVDSKAYISLEQFCVTMFHLYPTIYFHKKTRGLEYMFSLLVSRVFELISDGEIEASGLPLDHPFVKFFDEPSLDNTLLLDDALFWGSLHLFRDARDGSVSDIATLISNRRILPMLDVWKMVDEIAAEKPNILALSAAERVREVGKICEEICEEIKADSNLWSSDCYYDTADRSIYKPMKIPGGHPQQINVGVGGKVMDIASISPLVASSASFKICRIYYDERKYDKVDSLKSALSDGIELRLALL